VLVETGFQLLGAIEARVDGRALELGHLRQRCVLAVLLLDANRPVPVGELVDRVWGGHAPQRSRETLYGYVSRLRNALAAAGDVRITRQAPGYLLTVDPGTVDVHRFHRLVAAVRGVPDAEAGLEALEQALSLWRGPALPMLDTPWLNDVRAALDRARFGAELDRNDLALRSGRHARVLDAMAAAAAVHPLDERLAGQLMLALYRTGRQGDALDCYHRVRRRLRDELGVDPGAALLRLHGQILRADPALAGPSSTVDRTTDAGPSASGPRALRQVPAPPRTFTGRAVELGRLSELAGVSTRGAVCAIIGPGGVGKTWIARRWAHENRSRFPDGQLYADLRGFDPAGSPVPASVVIRGFLDALGVAPGAIPADLDAQAALYRGLAADRRLLIVLDNARDSAHVDPLLPGAGACTVLITSRHQLVGLVTAHGARPLTLGMLSGDEARHLLAGHLGTGRITAEPAAVDALVRHCAGLPLALGIVASRAAVHPGLPLTALAAELDDVTTRLDALDGGELSVSVRAALACSTDALAGPAARLFALLSGLAGPDARLAAVASLAGLPVGATRILLRQLAAAHLVAEQQPGRWQMHDLVRLFAAEQSGVPGERAAARRRLLDHYLHTGFAANRVLSPLRDAIEPVPPAPGVSVEAFGHHEEAAAWFTAEHANLLVAVALAADEGLDTHAWQLAWTMATYLDRYAHWRDQAAVHTIAEAAARRLGDRTAQAYALCGLARAKIWLGRYEPARDHLRSALDLLDDSDPAGQAHVHRAFARSYARDGDPRRALAHDERALALYRAAGHDCGQATALNAIGWHRAHLGEAEEALPFCERALALHRRIGDRQGAATTLDSLGYIHRQLGRYHEAIGCYRQAVEVFDESGDRYEMADTLASLGDTHAAAGDPDEARASWERAAIMLEALGVPTAGLRSRLVAHRSGMPTAISSPSR
jgi:DNA-binding SARP family transcriptional activator/tetratricopeptide (TPR) repeat protein